jgi:hypothetical protein
MNTKEKIIDILEGKVTPKRVIHKGYVDWETAKKKGIKFRQIFGKYQYIYTTNKGEISLVLLKDYYKKGENIWEIYCLKGNLFSDTERFSTKKDAEQRIFKLLI